MLLVTQQVPHGYLKVGTDHVFQCKWLGGA
jgi:hypothetical protein